ncbi:MAG: glycosyltransferase [Rhodocyclaceae bacterium]|nr:MAG: glycosyltransferase [Rhodocyclaceae bacterium]
MEAVALALAGLGVLPSSFLLLQTLAALVPRKSPALRTALTTVRRPRLAVLVPAHNEAAGIATTLAGLRLQLHLGDRLLVVADNCSDDTALRAEAAGAEVVRREDAARCGKGYALDYGLRYLAADPPSLVVVMDADCEAEPGALDRLARGSAASGRPVQALYLMDAGTGAAGGVPTLSAIAAFAWTVRNRVRPLGCLRLGLPCQLMGTGMALPWSLLQGVSLADGHIVEDIKLGLNLAEAGAAPLFCPEARVRSRFPETAEGRRQQRRRWEHGHLGMMLGAVPGYLWRGLRRGNWALVALALDLCIPPLALLVLVILGALAMAIAAWFMTEATVPLGLSLVAMVMVGAAVFSAWSGYGRQILGAGSLLLAPWYACAKLPLYLGFLVRRQVAWVRSERGPGKGD